MQWKSPDCIYCKKSISKPSDAVFLHSMKGERFGHVECYAKLLGKFAQDGKILSAGAAVMGGGLSGAVGGLAGYRKAEEFEGQAKLKRRADMQNTISSTSLYQIIIGIVFVAIAGFLFLGKVRLDAVVMIAGGVLGLIGLGTLYFGITYRMKLAEFEKLLS